jgi:hypothetical protein
LHGLVDKAGPGVCQPGNATGGDRPKNPACTGGFGA